MLDHIQKKRQELSNNIQKSYNLDHDYLEKGKRAEIGEVRMWGNEKWVKHQDGWVHLNEKTGKHKLERPGGKREDAGDHHVSHAKTHLDRHEREGSGKEKEIIDEMKRAHTMSDKDFKKLYGLSKEEAKENIKKNYPERYKKVFGKEEEKLK